MNCSNMDRRKKILYFGGGAILIIFILGLTLGLALRNKDEPNTPSTTESPATEKPTEPTDPGEEKSKPQILIDIRALLKNQGGEVIQAYLIPALSENSDVILERDQRVKYVSGFSGSNAEVIITGDKALLWTDSRYYEQAKLELDSTLWTLMKSTDATKIQWLKDNLPEKSKVGVDLSLLSSTDYITMSSALASNQIEIKGIEKNLVDEVWNTQPNPEYKEIKPHLITYSGLKSSEKIKNLISTLNAKDIESMIVTSAADIAWLFNLRGSDQSYSPFFTSYAVITPTENILFATEEAVTDAVKTHVTGEGITLIYKKYTNEEIKNEIDRVVKSTTGKILVPLSSNTAIYKMIPSERVIHDYSPIEVTKSIKNKVEADGMVAASKRDSIAIIKFLYWLEKNVDTSVINEISASEKLLELRKLDQLNAGASFNSISCYGDHSAIVHYSPTPETNRQIKTDNIYLIDSGGQYLDGTTDVTRTIHFGTPSEFHKTAFTLVLKGYLAIDAAIFPNGATGTFFDAIARQALWKQGLDYGHGTGHGVGAYGGVHEYPPLFSSSGHYANAGLVENIFTSNEPGYYKEGDFGIRIESIVQVVKDESKVDPYDFGGRGALKFNIATLVPIQTKLINENLLTDDEILQINSYHEKVLAEIFPLLTDNDEKDWLLRETQPIKRNDPTPPPFTPTTPGSAIPISND